MFLKDNACPTIPDADTAQVQHTSLQADSLQHTEKVCTLVPAVGHVNTISSGIAMCLPTHKAGDYCHCSLAFDR